MNPQIQSSLERLEGYTARECVGLLRKGKGPTPWHTLPRLVAGALFLRFRARGGLLLIIQSKGRVHKIFNYCGFAVGLVRERRSGLWSASATFIDSKIQLFSGIGGRAAR